MQLIRAALSVGSFTILSRIAGFVREMLQAHYLGVGLLNDAVQSAMRIPSLFRRIFAEGALNASFVPLFSKELSENGEKSALEFAQNIFSLLSLVLIGVLLLFEFFMPTLIRIIYWGFSETPERLRYTIEFTRITFPFLAFISLTAFFSGILNSYERFIAVAMSPFVGNIFIILSLLFITPFQENAGYALSWGVFLCGLAQLIWVYVPCRASGIKMRFQRPRLTPSLKRFLKVMLPAVAGSGVVQFNLFIDASIASFLKNGDISYLSYADRLNQLPLSVTGVAMSTALLPLLSKKIRTGKTKEAFALQNRAIEFCMLLTLPAAITLLLIPDLIVELLYYHGKFKQSDILPTAHTLMAFAWGLPAYVMIKVFSSCFFSHGNTKTPMFVGAISVMINLGLNILLIKPYAYVGIAAATATSAWMNALTLLYLLNKRGLIKSDKTLRTSLPKIILSAALLGAYYFALFPPIYNILFSFCNFKWFLAPAILIMNLLVYLGIAYGLGLKSLFKSVKNPAP